MTETGFAALMTVLLIGQGTILLMLGVLGEYLWRSFDESRGRPRFVLESHRQSTASFSTPSAVNLDQMNFGAEVSQHNPSADTSAGAST